MKAAIAILFIVLLLPVVLVIGALGGIWQAVINFPRWTWRLTFPAPPKNVKNCALN